MAVHFACGGKVGAMASLTNLGKPDAAAHKFMQSSPLILVALDFDPPDPKGKRPGAQGWAWWQKHYPQAQRWPVPMGKDPGEAFALGLDLAEWVDAALPESTPSPELRQNGGMGATSFEIGSLGGGDLQQSVATAEGAQGGLPWKPRRWQGGTEDAPLPEGCPSLERLREYYAGKALDDGLLVPCPALKTPWWWGYYKRCRTCAGHRECVVDVITSQGMLAPEVSCCA